MKRFSNLKSYELLSVQNDIENIYHLNKNDYISDLNEEELEILEIFKQKADWQIDELCMRSKISNSKIAAILLSLEMNGIIVSLPGKIYRCLS